MSTRKTEEIRTLEIGTLQEKLAEAKNNLFQQKLQHSLGKLENPSAIKLARRAIARINTVITEKVKGLR